MTDTSSLGAGLDLATDGISTVVAVTSAGFVVVGTGDLLAANMVAGDGGTALPPFSFAAAVFPSPKTRERAAPATALLMLARGRPPECLPVRLVIGVAMTPVARRSR